MAAKEQHTTRAADRVKINDATKRQLSITMDDLVVIDRPLSEQVVSLTPEQLELIDRPLSAFVTLDE